MKLQGSQDKGNGLDHYNLRAWKKGPTKTETETCEEVVLTTGISDLEENQVSEDEGPAQGMMKRNTDAVFVTSVKELQIGFICPMDITTATGQSKVAKGRRGKQKMRPFSHFQLLSPSQVPIIFRA